MFERDKVKQFVCLEHHSEESKTPKTISKVGLKAIASMKTWTAVCFKNSSPTETEDLEVSYVHNGDVIRLQHTYTEKYFTMTDHSEHRPDRKSSLPGNFQ